MKKHTRILCLLLAVMFVFGMVSGCAGDSSGAPAGTGDATPGADGTPGDTGDAAGTAAPKKDTLTVAVQDEPPTLGTTDHDALAAENMNRLLYNALMRIGDDLKPVPDLYKEYAVENDANGEPTIWTFKLHEGVKFHDGTVMTSADVVASIQAAQASASTFTYTKAIKTIEAVDGLTIKITTDGPSVTLLYDLCAHANMILPKALLDSGNDFNSNPVGTGPYKFVKWTRGDKLEFEAFEEYFDAENKASIKNLVYKIIPEASSRTIALEAGEVDLVVEVPATEKSVLSANENITVYEHPTFGLPCLVVNNDVKPFDNAYVRKAISSAVDRESIILAVMEGMATPAVSICPTGLGGENTENFDGYDMEKARAYLAAWGGDPSTIKLSIICNNEPKRKIAEIIQENLKDIGIIVDIESMDLATYMAATSKGDYTAYIGGYPGSSDLLNYITVLFHSSNLNGTNRARMVNSEIDRLIDEASRTMDEAAREAIVKRAVGILNDLCPMVALFQEISLKAYDKDLQGFNVNMFSKININQLSW